MNLRLSTPGAARGAWLTAGRAAAGAFLVAVAVTACTSGGSLPSTYTPTPQTGVSSQGSQPGARTSSSTSSSASSTSRAGASASGSAHASSSATAAPTAAPGVTTAVATEPPAATTAAPASSTYPTAAPQTGGGGTAGLQDGLLFGIGGAAILAGLGSLAYRRRLARQFRANRSAPRDQERRDPANR